MSPSRANLPALAEAQGYSLAYLSALLGRNAAYLQQHIRRESPRRLDEDDRLRLAKYLECDERLLGAREPWSLEPLRG